jgi:hypothetical protein
LQQELVAEERTDLVVVSTVLAVNPMDCCRPALELVLGLVVVVEEHPIRRHLRHCLASLVVPWVLESDPKVMRLAAASLLQPRQLPAAAGALELKHPTDWLLALPALRHCCSRRCRVDP